MRKIWDAEDDDAICNCENIVFHVFWSHAFSGAAHYKVVNDNIDRRMKD